MPSPDRCRALKWESVYEGGTQTDETFTEVSIGSDYLDAAGYCAQKPGAVTATSDTKVRIERDAADNWVLSDPNATSLQLQQLLTSVQNVPGSHNAVADIIHWLGDGGPGDGSASGAYRVITTTGILTSGITWYASKAANAAKLYDVQLTYTGLLVTQVVRTLYRAGAVVRVITDAVSYPSSVFAPVTTRTWT